MSESERIQLKRIHATIPERLYNKILNMNKMHELDIIITELLYQYVEESGADLNGKDKRNR